MTTQPPRPGAIPGWGEPEVGPSGEPGAQPTPNAGPASSSSDAIPGWDQALEPRPDAAPAASAPAGWGQVPVGESEASTGWGSGPPAPAPPSSGLARGCLILFGVVVVGGVLLLVLIAVLFGQMLEGFTGDLDDVDTPCAILTDDQARAVLGGDARVYAMTPLTKMTLGLVLDARVLADAAEECWIGTEGETAVGRVASHRGGDAAAVFAAEIDNAKPVREDQGGGLYLEREGYNAMPVSGVGDEAFCTGVSPAVQAGVVARRGDRVVYVSITPASSGAIPDFETNPDGVIYSPQVCRDAAELVRLALD
jgi:hypothetical protein